MNHAKRYFSWMVGLLALGAAPALAQDVTFKVHHFVGPGATAHTQLLGPWCDKVGRESGGKIKCQIYPAMQLGGTPPQLFDQARDGVADIVWTVPTYQAGRFTKSEVFELPHMTRTGEGGSRAFWEYVQKNALDEFKGVKIILLHVHDGSQLHFAGKSVKTLEDIKGMKVRSPTRIGARWLAAVGAAPVQMPVPQVPEAIAKGVVDGASLPWEIVPALKVNEIAKTHTETPKGFPHMSNTIFVVAMNQAKYDGLSAELKKVIDANSGAEMSAWAGKVWDGTVAAGRKSATDRGNAVNVLSVDEAKRWEKASASVAEEWKKEVAAKGGDGAALYAAARKLLDQYDNK